jgi:hypothetical protein
MRNQVSLVAAAMLTGAIACSGGTSRNTRAEQDAGTAGGHDAGAIRVEGCVQAAPGTNQYVLQHVSVASPEPPAPNDPMPHPPVILNGSWVRLDAHDQDMQPYLGSRVAVDGRLIDDGHSTLGTSGSSVRAPVEGAPSGANANGTAPKIAIERVTKLADSCPAEQEMLKEGHTGQRGRAPKQTPTGR